MVIHDELDIPFGALRLKFGGGDNGHNGLRSISQALGTRDYYRVRFGIGRPPGRMDAAAYVLRDFTAAERKDLPLFIERWRRCHRDPDRQGADRRPEHLPHRLDPPRRTTQARPTRPEERSTSMTNDDHALARELAEEAGRGLLELRARGFSDRA